MARLHVATPAPLRRGGVPSPDYPGAKRRRQGLASRVWLRRNPSRTTGHSRVSATCRISLHPLPMTTHRHVSETSAMACGPLEYPHLFTQRLMVAGLMSSPQARLAPGPTERRPSPIVATGDRAWAGAQHTRMRDRVPSPDRLPISLIQAKPPRTWKFVATLQVELDRVSQLPSPRGVDLEVRPDIPSGTRSQL